MLSVNFVARRADFLSDRAQIYVNEWNGQNGGLRATPRSLRPKLQLIGRLSLGHDVTDYELLPYA